MKKRYSIYAIARALMDQHDFGHDVAFLAAWYSQHPDEMPTILPMRSHAKNKRPR